MKQSIIIYGGGLAGSQLAHSLQNDADVTLVCPLDYFEIPMALPRGLIEPALSNRSIMLLSEALPGVRHIHGKLVKFEAGTGTVEESDGERLEISGDISVLATGSSYANSLTRAQSGNAIERRNQFESFADRLDQASKILIVGGGPIGIELAGEITQDVPGKKVTIVEANADILRGTSRKVASRALKTLEARGVTFHLGQKVMEPSFGTEPDGGVARTDKGLELEYDLIFWAVGSKPNTDYFPPDQLSPEGRIPVDQHLRVAGTDNVFALGDIAGLNEVKKAIYVIDHLKTVIKNIRSLLAGKPPRASYKAQTGNDIMVVTLGRTGGVGHVPVLGTITAGWLIRMIKAKDMLVGMYRKKVGVPANGG